MFRLFRKRTVAKSPARRTGDYGEQQAVAYLKQNGFRIRARNVQYEGREELDIVAEDRTTRRFVEVKTRRQVPDAENRYGTPMTAVTAEKRRHLLNAARRYTAAHPTRKVALFDIVEVYIDPAAEEPAVLAVRHHSDAFRA